MATNDSNDIRTRVLRGIEKSTLYADGREEIAAAVLEEIGAATDTNVNDAARSVITLYRASGWDALAGESNGGYKALPELEEALGDLDKALKGALIGPESAAIASAVERIHDALRYTELCAAALEPGGYTDARLEVQRTLGMDLQGALHDALVALGARVVDELGVYTDREGGQTAVNAS